MPEIPKSTAGLSARLQPARQPFRESVGRGEFDTGEADRLLEQSGRRSMELRHTAGEAGMRGREAAFEFQKDAHGHTSRARQLGAVGGLISGARSLFAEYERQQEEADRAAAKNGVSSYAQWANQMLYSGDHPLGMAQGKQAFDNVELFNKQADEQINLIAESLESDGAKQLFRDAVLSRSQAHRNQLARWGLAGHKQYIKESREANISTLLQDATTLAGTPEQEQMFAAIRAENLNRGRDMGFTGEELNRWVRAEDVKTFTVVHKAVVENMARENPVAARAYFEANKADIDARLYDDLDKTLDAAGRADAVIRISDDLMKRGLGEAAAKRAARAMYDAGEIDATTLTRVQSRLGGTYSTRRAGASEHRRVVTAKALVAINKQYGGDASRYFKDNPTHESIVARTLYPSAFRDLMAGKVDPVHNDMVYAQMSAMVKMAKTSDQVNAALNAVIGNQQNLSQSSRTGLINELVAKATGATPLKDPVPTVAKPAVKRAIQAVVGKTPGAKANQQELEDYAVNHALVEQAIEEKVDVWRQKNPGLEPPAELYEQAANSVMLGAKRETPGVLYGTNTETFSEVPSEERDAASSALTQMGITPSTDSIMRLRETENLTRAFKKTYEELNKADPAKYPLPNDITGWRSRIEKLRSAYVRYPEWRARIKANADE